MAPVGFGFRWGYPNKVEISALSFPGDRADDPNKVPAPFRIFSRQQMERLPQHTQLLLMNAHKSTDFYAKYTGVFMEELLLAAGILPTATYIKVYAPDGFSQYHAHWKQEACARRSPDAGRITLQGVQ